mmetsp:Transcript_37656/g.62032  ORF Transcript_37656/g.62032 Transcript_37656/m.62032 type:complete len:120 (+) Transcript_37656:359-718(+)
MELLSIADDIDGIICLYAAEYTSCEMMITGCPMSEPTSLLERSIVWMVKIKMAYIYYVSSTKKSNVTFFSQPQAPPQALSSIPFCFCWWWHRPVIGCMIKKCHFINQLAPKIINSRQIL